jgi:hypothetical protein
MARSVFGVADHDAVPHRDLEAVGLGSCG